MHMSSWPCEFDYISLNRRCLSMTVLVINALAECTWLWTRGFVATHPISGVMAARVVVLWDKSASSYIALIIESLPFISSRWVIAIVSGTWILGVGGMAVLFVERIELYSKGMTNPYSAHSLLTSDPATSLSIPGLNFHECILPAEATQLEFWK